MVYDVTREEAVARVKALALRVLADRLEHGETISELRCTSKELRLHLPSLLV
jgi:hypothetical protein